MTGDGVNDLLALRQADCSIAMGNGSDAAKQTAELVLLDSDFGVLKDVISEGRRVINNMTKSAGVFFIKTFYSVLLCILCLFFNWDFPFIPIQITLIDAVIEAFPAFFMSFEKNDRKVEGTFLRNAVTSALPDSIAIFACCLVFLLISPALSINELQCNLLMYLSVGFISLAAVAKSCMPFNSLRLFLLSVIHNYVYGCSHYYGTIFTACSTYGKSAVTYGCGYNPRNYILPAFQENLIFFSSIIKGFMRECIKPMFNPSPRLLWQFLLQV